MSQSCCRSPGRSSPAYFELLADEYLCPLKCRMRTRRSDRAAGYGAGEDGRIDRVSPAGHAEMIGPQVADLGQPGGDRRLSNARLAADDEKPWCIRLGQPTIDRAKDPFAACKFPRVFSDVLGEIESSGCCGRTDRNFVPTFWTIPGGNRESQSTSRTIQDGHLHKLGNIAQVSPSSKCFNDRFSLSRAMSPSIRDYLEIGLPQLEQNSVPGVTSEPHPTQNFTGAGRDVRQFGQNFQPGCTGVWQFTQVISVSLG